MLFLPRLVVHAGAWAAMAIVAGISIPRDARASEVAATHDPSALPGYRVLSRFEVSRASLDRIEHWSQEFSVEGKIGELVSVYVPHSQVQEFLVEAPDAVLVEDDVDAFMRNMSAEQWATYRSYAEIEDLLDGYVASHGDWIERYSPGWFESDKGTEILAIHLAGKGSRQQALASFARPVFVLFATIHGDEFVATEVSLGVLDALISGYGSDDRLTKILDRSEIYWIPVLSPDSFQLSREVNGSDPNREFPFPNDPTPEVTLAFARNFQRFLEEVQPASAMDWHGSTSPGMIMYPWAHTQDPIDDPQMRGRMDDLGDAMALTNGYDHGPVATTIYVAEGDTTDYIYWKNNAISMTLEVGGGDKKPAVTELAQLIEENKELTWLLFEEALDQLGDIDPPTIEVVEPSTGDTFDIANGKASVKVSAKIDDGDGSGVASSWLEIGGNATGDMIATAPFVWELELQQGSYELVVWSRDNAGNQANSATLAINVVGSDDTSDTSDTSVSHASSDDSGSSELSSGGQSSQASDEQSGSASAKESASGSAGESGLPQASDGEVGCACSAKASNWQRMGILFFGVWLAARRRRFRR